MSGAGIGMIILHGGAARSFFILKKLTPRGGYEHVDIIEMKGFGVIKYKVYSSGFQRSVFDTIITYENNIY